MTTLYLARHGETVDNANHIMQGQTQGRLTEKGREQARQLADAMTGVHIDAFVSSDLKRAIDTCAIVAEARDGNVVTTPLLRERDWGSFTGRYIPDLKDAVWTNDIESIDALKERARKFLQSVSPSSPGNMTSRMIKSAGVLDNSCHISTPSFTDRTIYPCSLK